MIKACGSTEACIQVRASVNRQGGGKVQICFEAKHGVFLFGRNTVYQPQQDSAGQLNSTFLEGINKVVEENLESRGKKMRYLLSHMNYLFLCLCRLYSIVFRVTVFFLLFC